MKTDKPVLAGLPCDELTRVFAPLPGYRSIQIFKWIARGAQTFDEMSDLPLTLRTELNERFRVRSCAVSACVKSPDGTVKLGISLEDGITVEAVLLTDDKNRKTACLSTQAGCPIGCVFCKTGALGFLRNLDSAEIVEQFLLLRETGGEISNIVIMGMGEPFLNLDELRRALSIIRDPRGLGLSKRRVTVSTCGIGEGIIDLADNGPDVRLALSLTTADECLRERLMPISRGQKLETLKNALAYFQKSGGGRVTLEAVLLGGINTRRRDAEALADFSRGLEVVVNLIPWIPFETPPAFTPALREPERGETAGFKKLLESLGLKVTCRLRRGSGISGACGQLVVSDTHTPFGDQEKSNTDGSRKSPTT
jgi:23S rRNA (adenine2503-C2)-methyltransferase